MNKKITLKIRKTFEAFAGEVSLGIFEIDSEWNGFTKLKSDNGEMIVNRASTAIQCLGEIIGQDEEVEVVKASPSLCVPILSPRNEPNPAAGSK